MNAAITLSLVGLFVSSHAIEGPQNSITSPARKLLMIVSEGGNANELGHCMGDCDFDSDCQGDLVCVEHLPYHDVPGCIGGDLLQTRSDYCVYSSAITPTSSPIGMGPMKLAHCQGDCDSDSDCGSGLVCFEHIAFQHVPGCPWGEQDPSLTDYCIYESARPPQASAAPMPSPTPGNGPRPDLVFLGTEPPPTLLPLGHCEGDCDDDSECDTGLICFQRDELVPVPGCKGVDYSKSDYCIYPDSNGPPVGPPSGEVKAPKKYTPGKLNVRKLGLLLSEGLDVRLVATSGEKLIYGNGVASQETFHGAPDAGAAFADTRPGKEGHWIYASNSEEKEGGQGGVGAIAFDSNGNTMDYQMILTGTTANCGGGRTPWNTWVSCEENGSNGEVYQVDPTGQRAPEKVTLGEKGNWESFAYDLRDGNNPHFFITEDSEWGCLRRYSPTNPTQWTDDWAMLHGDAVVDYLILHPDGFFEWTTNKQAALQNAQQHYQFSEGIDVKGSELFFVCKKAKEIFTLNLDYKTWKKESTVSGLFSGQPDQLHRLIGDSEGLLYFTEEDGLYAGIHARDKNSRFYTIVEAVAAPLTGETTGLTVSPDGRFMLFAYQEMGKLFMLWREDGLPFPAKHIDVKYHEA